MIVVILKVGVVNVVVDKVQFINDKLVIKILFKKIMSLQY